MKSYQLSSGAKIHVDGNVDSEIVANGKHIILIDEFDSIIQTQSASQNIVCFDGNGTMLWLVEKREYDKYENPYTFLKYHSENLFKTSTFKSTQPLLMYVDTGKFAEFAP